MKTIEKNLEFLEGRWHIAITGRRPDGTTERVRKSFRTKSEAVGALDDFRGKRDRWRRGIDEPRPKAAPVTFEACAQKLIDDYSVHQRHNTLLSHKQALRALLPSFKGRALTEISPALVSSWYSSRRSKAPVAANREMFFLKLMFKKAKAWFEIERDPTASVEMGDEPETSIRVLTDEEAARLLDAAEPKARTIIQVLLTTGLRKTEALSLCWEYPGWDHDTKLKSSIVSFRRGIIHVPSLLAKSTKSREVPLSPELEALFRGLQAGPGFPAPGLARTGSKSDLVFGVKEIWHWLKKAADAAGIKGLTVHHLRHTAASRMLKAGVDVKTVQEILGHSSLDITLRYLHTDSTAKRDAIAKLSRIYLATSQKLANEGKSKTQTIEIKPFKNVSN